MSILRMRWALVQPVPMLRDRVAGLLAIAFQGGRAVQFRGDQQPGRKRVRAAPLELKAPVPTARLGRRLQITHSLSGHHGVRLGRGYGEVESETDAAL